MSDAEKILKEFGRKIDELIEKAKSGEMKEEVKEEIDEAIEALKKQRDQFEAKMKDFKEKNEPKMQEAKVHLRSAMEELNQAFQKMFRKGPGAEVVNDED